jgi:hypothetical protein
MGRFCFWPCDGGLNELSGVFGGRVNSSSRASKAAIRAACATIVSCAVDNCPIKPRINRSLSAWLSLLRSGAAVTQRLESGRPLPCQAGSHAINPCRHHRTKPMSGPAAVGQGEQLHHGRNSKISARSLCE